MIIFLLCEGQTRLISESTEGIQDKSWYVLLTNWNERLNMMTLSLQKCYVILEVQRLTFMITKKTNTFSSWYCLELQICLSKTWTLCKVGNVPESFCTLYIILCFEKSQILTKTLIRFSYTSTPVFFSSEISPTASHKKFINQTYYKRRRMCAI